MDVFFLLCPNHRIGRYRLLTCRMAGWVGLLTALALTGCSTLRPDHGFIQVNQTIEQQVGVSSSYSRNEADQATVQSTVNALLADPLSLERALQIALINNRALQATYAELGIAEADLVQAGRLSNPGLTIGRTRRGDELLIDRTWSLNIINLLTLPLATRIEKQRYEAVRLSVTQAALQVANDTRKAWFEAVAAEQAVRYARQVELAAQSGAELAKAMHEVGNNSKRDLLREASFFAETTAYTTQANHTALTTREQLNRLLGLMDVSPNSSRYHLPDRLPDLPDTPLQIDNAQSLAMRHRLDLQAEQQSVAALAQQLGLTRTTRFINVLTLEVIRNSASQRPPERGYAISLEVPLFDWGDARVEKAQARYMQAVHTLANKAVNVQSEVRTAYQRYRSQYDLAKHYRDTVVPLRKQIADENLLRYNGMLISVFELLSDAREQIQSVTQYLYNLRDYWIAESHLQFALGSPLANLKEPQP